jgi:hypothetical protein
MRTSRLHHPAGAVSWRPRSYRLYRFPRYYDTLVTRYLYVRPAGIVSRLGTTWIRHCEVVVRVSRDATVMLSPSAGESLFLAAGVIISSQTA